MTGYKFTLNGKEINTKDIDFINIIYIGEHDMDVSIHFADRTVYRTITDDEKLFLKLDEYADISSEK